MSAAPPGSVAPPDYVPVEEAAAALGIARATLYRILKIAGMRSYLFPSSSGGRHAFVTRGDLEQLQELRQHPTPASDAGSASTHSL